MKRLSLLLTILLGFNLSICGADWIPFVVNYGKNDYGNGASTWRIISYGEWTFFANQKGLLVYDGVNWSHYQLNNRSENRGVAVFPNLKRIYVGGENEYGYFVVGSSGELKYHCISDNMPQYLRYVGNIWDFYEWNGIHFFRGDKCVIVAAGHNMSLVQSEDKIFDSAIINGTIYVTTNHGVKMFVGKQFLPIPNGEALVGKRLNGLMPFGKGMMIATANDGLYYYDGSKVTPYITSADAILKSGEISCMTINCGKIAIGTIHDGVVIINSRTGGAQYYNEVKGLQSNTILSVAFDSKGNVWVGMDYGIDHILLEAPFSYLYRSPKSFGIGYSAIIKDGLLYLGTDRGLYSARYPVMFKDGLPEISKVACPNGPVWYLYNNNGELFCMHDKGIFVVKGGVATKITDISGAWSCQAVKGKPDMMFIGVYDGIFVIRKVNGVWMSLGKIKGINYSGRYFEQIGGNVLRVYNPNMGVAADFTLDKSLTMAVGQRQLRKRLVDADYEIANKLFSDWNITGDILKVSRDEEIIPYDRGFAMVNMSKIHDVKMKVIITRMSLSQHDGAVAYMSNYCGIKPKPRIEYANNTVCFDWQMQSLLSSMDTKYEYRLNDEAWSVPSKATSKEYDNLKEGNYTFEVRAVLYDGKVTTDTISFVILPPWYRSWIAYLVYLVMITCGIVVLIRLERKRIAGKQEQAVFEKNKEVKQMKIEIDKLEKDKMELDMRHKSQEIANLMINVSRKNEILTDLKKEIQQVTSRVDTSNSKELKRQMLLINNKIDSNMEGDDVLKRFEEQFDVVNDNVIRKLSKLHPDLNANERLMCAYLRMNLSTKDIAPLLNLSIRGVESIRYRLRKKLNLERDENIREYLNGL